MTTQTRNEAAERVRDWINGDHSWLHAEPNRWLDEALVAERRAMVDRLAQTLRDADMALKWSRPDRAGLVSLSDIAAILKEEAQR